MTEQHVCSCVACAHTGSHVCVTQLACDVASRNALCLLSQCADCGPCSTCRMNAAAASCAVTVAGNMLVSSQVVFLVRCHVVVHSRLLGRVLRGWTQCATWHMCTVGSVTRVQCCTCSELPSTAYPHTRELHALWCPVLGLHSTAPCGAG
jgi:hypothetical protein